MYIEYIYNIYIYIYCITIYNIYIYMCVYVYVCNSELSSICICARSSSPVEGSILLDSCKAPDSLEELLLLSLSGSLQDLRMPESNKKRSEH